MRNFFLVTHRWLGLTLGAVLIVIGLTGAVLVWVKVPIITRFHVDLGLGRAGRWLVDIVTLLSAFLIVGGVVLWWKRKRLRIDRSKGWWRLLFDLHHTLGIIGAALMLVIALSGVGLMLTAGIGDRMGLARADPGYPTRAERLTRAVIHAAHTGGPVRKTLGVLWVLASAGFAFQAISGVVIWWKPKTARAD